MKRIEKVIILVLLIFALIIYLVNKLSSNEVLIVNVKNSEGYILLSFDINEDNYYELEGKYGLFHVEVKNGKCRAIDVDCPNQICVHTGWISADNPTPIICLPNGIVVQINE